MKAAAVLFALAMWGAPVQAAPMTLVVCVNTDIPDSNVVLAVPTDIFRSMGVSILWRPLGHCPHDGIEVRLLRAAPENLPLHALGCAHPLEGRKAEVFLDRVQEAFPADRAKRNALLGSVIAHELIHLVEGDRTQHSEDGIMRGEWSTQDSERLFWHSEVAEADAVRIRQGLERRNSGNRHGPGGIFEEHETVSAVDSPDRECGRVCVRPEHR